METPDYAKRLTNAADQAAILAKRATLPKDLTEWVGSFSLIRQTLEAIEQVKPVFMKPNFKTTFGTYRPQMLLTLMTYAYAKGLTGSREIELAIPNNKALKYICAGDRPDWNVLRLFRRQYQKLIQNCLAEVAKRAWEIQYPSARPAPEGNDYAEASLNRWLAPGQPDFAAEAARRVRLGILADSLLSDE